MKKKPVVAVTVPSRIEKLQQSIIPPPTKADLIHAMAKTIVEEKEKEAFASRERINKANDKANEALRRLAPSIKGATVTVEPTHTEHNPLPNKYGNYVPRPRIIITFNNDDCIAAELKGLNDAQAEHVSCPRVESVMQELRAKANDRSHIIAKLMEDKDVKASLLAAAKGILKTMTTGQKASAIET